MTLSEALGIINRNRPAAAGPSVYLACGFQPLHLATFVQAYATARLGKSVQVLTGLFGDLVGNLEKASQSSATAVAVAVEWADLDPRLGLRSTGGWSKAAQDDIVPTCAAQFAAVYSELARLAARHPLAISGPTLPLPPIGHTSSCQAGAFEMRLSAQRSEFLKCCAEIPGARVLSTEWLNETAPPAARLDPQMTLVSGFPYTRSFTDTLAGALVELLFPREAKKGLVVDLDETLWAGIAGEAGPDGVSWDQEHHTQVHGLLQQMLAQLAENGVLLGVSSKNDPSIVDQALARADLLVPRTAFWPVIANWAPKSEALREILAAWNIGADSVVFLDDSEMELSEVQAVFPEITGLRFNAERPAQVWETLRKLRELFGKPAVFEEDRLRVASLRSGAAVREAVQRDPEAFLRGLQGRIVIDYQRGDAGDRRPLELINKTNQFNLNGARLTEGEWLDALRNESAVSAVVSYEDKFGALGKIAAVLGQKRENVLEVTSWVMSCRAFSRRIEHHLLDSLFHLPGVEEIVLHFRPTGRNQPLCQFFQDLGILPERPPTGPSSSDSAPAERLHLSRRQLASLDFHLPHSLTENLP